MIERGASAFIEPSLSAMTLENCVTQAGCFFIDASMFRPAVWTVHQVSIFLDGRMLPN